MSTIRDVIRSIYPREENIAHFPRVERDEQPTRPLHHAPQQASGYAPPFPRLPANQEYEIQLAKSIFVDLSQIPTEARDRVMGMVNNLMSTYAPPEKDITPHPHPQGAPV
jgi:hypothetical protein